MRAVDVIFLIFLGCPILQDCMGLNSRLVVFILIVLAIVLIILVVVVTVGVGTCRVQFLVAVVFLPRVARVVCGCGDLKSGAFRKM